jgi:hypothetical protein
MVAESSAMLTTTLGNTLMALMVAGCSNNDGLDNKLSDFKEDLFNELDARETSRVEDC